MICGILNKANRASKDTNDRAAEEEIKLIILEVQAENNGKATFENIIKKLEENKQETYVVTRKSKYATLTTVDGRGIISTDELDGTEVAIYITNLKYDREVKVTSKLKVNVTEEGEGSSDSKLEQKEKEIKELQEERDGLQQRVSELESEINKKQQEIDNLKVQVTQKDKKISELQNQITQLQNQLNQSQSKQLKKITGTLNTSTGTYYKNDTATAINMSFHTNMSYTSKEWGGDMFRWPELNTGLTQIESIMIYLPGQLWMTCGSNNAKFLWNPIYYKNTSKEYEQRLSWKSNAVDDLWGWHSMAPKCTFSTRNGKIVVNYYIHTSVDVENRLSTAMVFHTYVWKDPEYIIYGY